MTTPQPFVQKTPFNWRRFWKVSTPVGLVVALAIFIAPLFTPAAPLNLGAGIDQVTCDNAREASNQLSLASSAAKSDPADYSQLEKLGFKTPVTGDEYTSLMATVQSRLTAIGVITTSVTNGTCDDAKPKMVTVTIGGKQVDVPLVVGGDPNNPTVGSDANANPDTAPVNVGTPAEGSSGTTWTTLDKTFGTGDNNQWYRDCTEEKLGVKWDTDVPKYKHVEDSGGETRVILAINVSPNLSPEDIRARVARDNPDIDADELAKMQIVPVPHMLNTRHLKQNRCDVFVQTKSELRVSTGVPVFDELGVFTGPGKDKGILDHCDNFWMLVDVKLPQQTETPQPSTSANTPTSPAPPVTTPPPPGVVCLPGEVWNGKMCVESKLSNLGAVANGKISDQNQGQAPAAAKTPEPKPQKPPATYQPPAQTKQPQPTRTSVPTVEQPAPVSSAPATGCVPPRGKTTC